MKYFIEKTQWLYFIAAIIFIVFFFIWIFSIAPNLIKIPNNFSYSAEVLSLDNFYDERLKKFEGEQISKTNFSYSVLASNKDYLTIKNLFVVRKLNDEHIFSVERLYFINPFSGKHVEKQVSQSRHGYLFAPRYTHKNDFYYWHVNYDAPALMKFLKNEKIDGLNVAQYQAKYSADQTANLGYLPGVPTARGIKVDVTLNVWIEPISGWLIKYQDNSIAYYYDRTTGKKLSLWNQFSNRFAEKSIYQQVQHARRLKWKIIFVHFIVPTLLVMIVFLCLSAIFLKTHPKFLNRLRNINIYNKRFFLIAFSIFLIGILYFSFSQTRFKKTALIGISQWSDSQDYLDTIQGFKAGLAEEGFLEGKNIRFLQDNPRAMIENQIKLIQSFLDKQVDLIFVLTTPGTLIAKGMTDKTPIVFSIVTYPKEANIVASLKSSENNLVGTRNYISPALQFRQFEEIFTDTKVLGFVHHKSESNSMIQFDEFESMLKSRGIQILDIGVIDLSDLEQQLLRYKNKYNALFIACDTLNQSGGGKIVSLFALQHKIPNFSCIKEDVLQGALIGYVADVYNIGKAAGKKAAYILKGVEPSWLYTDSVDRGYVIINLKTARQLGIKIPPNLLNKADYIVKDE